MRIVRMIIHCLAVTLCWQFAPAGAGVEPMVRKLDLAAELPTILGAAHRNNCHGDDLLILLAIRLSENGRPGREFGVLDPRCRARIEAEPHRSLNIQAGWSAATIVKNRARWRDCGHEVDFITFLGNRYCPAETDPEGNRNWKKNVRYFYEKFKKK